MKLISICLNWLASIVLNIVMPYLRLWSDSLYISLVIDLLSLVFNGSLLWLRWYCRCVFTKFLLISCYYVSNERIWWIYHVNAIHPMVIVTIIRGVKSCIYILRMTLRTSSSTTVGFSLSNTLLYCLWNLLDSFWVYILLNSIGD